MIPAMFLVLLLSGCDSSPPAKKTWELAPRGGIFSAAFSNQNALIGSVDGTAYLWKLGKKKPRFQWRHGHADPQGMIAVAISANEKYALTAQRDSLAWWRISDGKLLGSWGFDSIRSLDLSADGTFALIGLAGKAVYFALRAGRTVYAFDHNASISATAMSAGQQFALTGAADGTATLWSLKNGQAIHHWKHRSKIASVALDPKNRFAMTSEALGRTRVWSIKSGKLRKQLGPDIMTVSAASFSPNGKYLATGRTTQRIDLWKLKTGKNVKHWSPRKASDWRPTASPVLAVEFLPNGKALLSASSNGYAQLWRMR